MPPLHSMFAEPKGLARLLKILMDCVVLCRLINYINYLYHATLKILHDIFTDKQVIKRKY